MEVFGYYFCVETKDISEENEEVVADETYLRDCLPVLENDCVIRFLQQNLHQTSKVLDDRYNDFL